MISCTEFIPAYSEGFKFIENEGGRKVLEDFWSFLSDTYLKDSLARLIEEEGLEGAFIYWSQALNEEAADFRMVFDGIKGEQRSNMYHCPSMGMLQELKYMEPYHAYCDHCFALYHPVFERSGYNYEKMNIRCSEASCDGAITIKKQ